MIAIFFRTFKKCSLPGHWFSRLGLLLGRLPPPVSSESSPHSALMRRAWTQLWLQGPCCLQSCYVLRSPSCRPSRDFSFQSLRKGAGLPSLPFYETLTLGHWPAYESVFLRLNDHSWLNSLCGADKYSVPFTGPRRGSPLEGVRAGPHLQKRLTEGGSVRGKILCTKIQSWATDSLQRSAQKRLLVWRMATYQWFLSLFPLNHLKQSTVPCK